MSENQNGLVTFYNFREKHVYVSGAVYFCDFNEQLKCHGFNYETTHHRFTAVLA